MVKLRKGISYRRLERPYTRYSKFQKLNFVRARPVNKVIAFVMGDPKKTYDYTMHLCSKTNIQLRDNSIEAARQSSNRTLEKKLGKGMYHFVTRLYPHHILRENPLASGAGADRMSTGMARSFGKPIGRAARVYAGQPLFTLQIKKKDIAVGRLSLKRAGYKLACGTTIEIGPYTGPLLDPRPGQQDKLKVEK